MSGDVVMNVRLKKLIGTIVMAVFLTVYCLLVMTLAVRLLPEAGGLAQLAFYVFFGFLWIVPVGWLIKWMQRPA
ncbi:MAG: DUF2842 domain-containing protein [Pseudomonadota bacterium]